MGFNSMFKEKASPLSKHIPHYERMLAVLNKLLQEAPHHGEIGPPVGFSTFLNKELNGHFKRMFDKWATFLSSPASASVLGTDKGGWFSKPALTALAENFDGLAFEHIFECDPAAKNRDGFTSLRPHVRPIELADNPNIIGAACESQLYNIAKDVKERDTFWLKDEPYSLRDMLNHDEFAAQFVGGTVYQGFLQVTGYHRWHSPAPGVVKKIVTHTPVIFVEADNPLIGLFCFIAIGMSEVSTAEATVTEGQRVKRGDELGMFHFGGSSHALVFRPETKIQFFDGFDKIQQAGGPD
ncbi:hypothetical protein DFH09DRAFT_1408640 [Mycena vulgaris]|nr:hypothetical protein DFH09DRAFT_1408640 [Mycena vulgaris]